MDFCEGNGMGFVMNGFVSFGNLKVLFSMDFVR